MALKWQPTSERTDNTTTSQRHYKQRHDNNMTTTPQSYINFPMVSDRTAAAAAMAVLWRHRGRGRQAVTERSDVTACSLKQWRAVAAKTAQSRCKVVSIRYIYYFRAYQSQRTLHMASESLLSCTSPFLRQLRNQWPWISLRGHSRSSILVSVESEYNIGSRALSFSDPYFHFTCPSVCHSFCLSVRNFGAKYLGNEAR